MPRAKENCFEPENSYHSTLPRSRQSAVADGGGRVFGRLERLQEDRVEPFSILETQAFVEPDGRGVFSVHKQAN